MKLDELFKHYLEDIDLTHQDTTIDSIRYVYFSGIHQRFGEKEINDIGFQEIKKFQKEYVNGKIKSKQGKKYSINYINKIILLIKRFLKYSIVMNYSNFTIEQSRGLEGITPVVDKSQYTKEQLVWNLQDFNRFISTVDNTTYIALFNVLFFTGIRKGELLALKWENVDLIDQTIKIDCSACRIKGEGQKIKAPKSKSSKRIIYINHSLNELLLEYYLEKKNMFGNQNISHHFVFRDHRMMSFSTLDRAFRKYKSLSDVSDMNLHGFRHSHATMMLFITNDVWNVSKRLGHENIEITDTYLHVNAKIQREMAASLEKVVQNEKNNSYEALIEKLKKDLMIELTSNSYTTEELNNIKGIYDFISN